MTAIAASWLATRLAMTRSAQGLARRRARLWRELAPTMERTPALAAYAGGPLQAVPVTEVVELRADYGRWNSLGCGHAELHAAALDAEAGGAGEVRPGVVAGYSTGSGGMRGIFLASGAERADYIGQILARVVPVGALLRPMRVALMLRANSRLYSDSAVGKRAFLHLPLDMDLAEAAAALVRFSPTILIAPSSRLLRLVEQGLRLPDLGRLFYGAEPMGEGERAWIEGELGLRPDPIYQATEGFLGAACAEGRLHLNDHSLAVELEPVVGTEGFRPIVTDLRRRSQPIVRVRMDDVIEPDPAPCSCGYAGRVIWPVMGRLADLWRYPGLTVTPARLAESLDALISPPAQWQAIGREDHVELRLDGPARHPGIAERLRADLGLPVPVRLSKAPPEPAAPKRRRMVWHG